MSFQFDLGKLSKKKNPFENFTKSALVAMLEDAVSQERERTLPAHKRDEDKEHKKDDDEVEADEEREKLADLAEETHGKPAPVEMDEEDLSDKAMDRLKKKVTKTAPKKKSA
jgi:hypothetical protein